MKITRLTVQNLLRIKAAEVRPDGSLVMVAGRNDQGKTSLLNSIAIALSGKDVPAQPIRAGANSGHVILETEELVVTRKFSASGGGSLEVRDKDGARVLSPQAKLDALVSRVTFDPFEFTRMKPDAQVATLRTILGLDFTALDNELKEKYDARTVINRQVKEKDGLLKQTPRNPEAPAEEISVADLTAKLTAAQKVNQANEKQRDEAGDACDAVDAAVQRRAAIEFDIAEAEKALREARAKHDEANKAVAEAVKKRDELKAQTDGLEDVDVDEIMAELAQADEKNAAFRSNQKWQETHKAMVDLQQQSNELTHRLSEIDEEKRTRLEKAEYPVPGLGFSDSGVTYNGLPFEQAGTAVKIRVSVAIARSLNPKLPVMLVRDGSLLDQNSLELLAAEAEEHGCQIWMEVVGTRDDATVVIEDGEVIARPAEEKKKKKGAK